VRSGEVLVLDMGEPVRIFDVARRLVAQSKKPVRIVFTGLRPGEKLHEELFGDGEHDHRQRHQLISHAAVPPLDPAELTKWDPRSRGRSTFTSDPHWR
jgi:FlaA1/EpsC-like NDP-sugar epimerase